MSYIKQYMQNARNFANESYLNADGFFEDNSSYFTANEDFYSADGMAMAAPAPTRCLGSWVAQAMLP